MTLQEIKNEVDQRLSFASSMIKTPYGDSTDSEWIGKQEVLKEVLLLFTELSAPELVWRQVDETEWDSETPAGTYLILLEDGVYGLYRYGYVIKLGLDIGEIKATAQAHWDELYKQLINLQKSCQ